MYVIVKVKKVPFYAPMSAKPIPTTRYGHPPKPVRRYKPPGVKPIKHIRHPQSPTHGVVLVVGEVQSGKSSVVNVLFGGENRQISPIQDRGTINIWEFRSVDNLRVIDTPGLGTPSWLERDAQIMASLKKIFDTDAELSRYIPHMVVVVTRFDAPESEFGHPESGFVKTLKALNLLRARLFDEQHSNIIIVLTHFMDGQRKYRLVPQPLLDKVKSIVRIYVDVPCDPYVVVAENHTDRSNLPRVGNNVRLTNGDLYPENLKEAMLSVARNSKSLIGYEYFFRTLRETPNINFDEPLVFRMVDPERTRYRKFLEAIVLAYSSSSV
ncbi:unnamed protein product [Allacma fusca]|uniref:G domain-containing protein n=1 Tax=Allacma fusca TaxID=39272 RepID=A0A8J2LJM5_9HEXA|nr:unnamed protein product [Allacma fusca]